MVKELIESNLKLAFSFAHKFTRLFGSSSKYDYEDTVSDCLLGLVKAAHGYNTNSGTKFSTYAYTCMKNEVMMSLRKKIKHQEHHLKDNPFGETGEVLEELGSEEPNYAFEEERIIDSVWLKAAFKTLNEIENEIIDSHYFEDLKICEIAKHLGFTESYISKIHNNALKKLRNYG